MAIVTVAYDVPDHIWEGLRNGELSRFGSVIRDRARITEHLKEVPLPVNFQASDLGRRATAVKNPAVAVGLGVVVLAGAVMWRVKSKWKSAGNDTPKCVEEYNSSLKAYLVAIQSGNPEVDTVNRLLESLDAVKMEFDSGKMALDVSPAESEALIDLIADYTRKLADANSMELGEPEAPSIGSLDRSILALRHYLEVQQSIFNRVT